MLNPVALSDFALALEDLTLAALLVRLAPTPLRRWFAVFFVTSAASALLGGVVHAFLAEASRIYIVMWVLTLLALGITAFAGQMAAVHLLINARAIRIGRAIAVGLFAAYVALVLTFTNNYRIAAWDTALAAATLLLGFLVAASRGVQGAMLGVAGLAVVFLATLLQQTQVSLGALDYNTIYHLLLMIAMALIFAGACKILEATRDRP